MERQNTESLDISSRVFLLDQWLPAKALSYGYCPLEGKTKCMHILLFRYNTSPPGSQPGCFSESAFSKKYFRCCKICMSDSESFDTGSNEALAVW